MKRDLMPHIINMDFDDWGCFICWRQYFLFALFFTTTFIWAFFIGQLGYNAFWGHDYITLCWCLSFEDMYMKQELQRDIFEWNDFNIFYVR